MVSNVITTTTLIIATTYNTCCMQTTVCSDGSAYAACTTRPYGNVFNASTHQQLCKRTEGRKIINQLIADLNSLKYVHGVSVRRD